MENDTVKLLRECNAGIKMGESAISKVLPHAKNEEMKKTLEVCKNTHASLGDETHAKLLSLGAETKDPHPVIRAMSDMKIYAKTGTSSETNDIWFVGGTPYYVASCWYGYDNNGVISQSGLARKL